MPHTLAMATLKVVVSSGEAYGNCKLASFTNSAGLHNHWSPSAPGNCSPNPSQMLSVG